MAIFLWECLIPLSAKFWSDCVRGVLKHNADIGFAYELTTSSGLKIVSAITKESLETLGLAQGKTVTATVKAPWVVLVKDGKDVKTSARNRFCGKISAISKKVTQEALAKGNTVQLVGFNTFKICRGSTGDGKWRPKKIELNLS